MACLEVEETKVQLLLATRNAGKKLELTELLSTYAIEVLALDDVPALNSVELPETGTTFRENALQKARTAAELSSVASLADDSGLEVSFLAGAPGVQSARWHSGSDLDRCQALLDKLLNATDRSAQFVCELCLYYPDTQVTEFFTGSIKGSISDSIASGTGFGYDPIFIPDGQTKPFSQLGVSYKNEHSHRARAFKKLAEYFLKL